MTQEYKDSLLRLIDEYAYKRFDEGYDKGINIVTARDKTLYSKLRLEAEELLGKIHAKLNEVTN